MTDLDSIALIIPTLNAASAEWASLARAIAIQGVSPQQVLIVDSESTDGTGQRVVDSGFRLVSIPRARFNHGGTRQWALQFFPEAEIIVYLTQDAILVEHALRSLVSAFRDPKIAAAFGRQLPRKAAGPVETHARLYNYSRDSSIRSLASRDSMGLKSIFFSNSFGAYRRQVLESIGGFPTNVILGEDTIVAARLLLSGWNIAYVAEAQAYHSHSLSTIEEFKRYFDTGVLHSREPWLLKEFGGASGEGLRFVKSELRYLWRNRPALIPLAFLRTATKLAGYKLGRVERKLGRSLKQRLSMHHRFWTGVGHNECP
ncbi:MAG TPA: glycosyltransferase family 2 protein [Silvibacterium sp.]|nr:glycosyltransferase family 2 protein [Silvibacterium sp.]